MKYLKTFESFSPINEEEEILNFLRGGSKEEIAQKKSEFEKKFEELEKNFKKWFDEGKLLKIEEQTEQQAKKIGEIKDTSGLFVMMKHSANDKSEKYNKATLLKWADKNNYLGTYKVVESPDKIKTKDGGSKQYLTVVWSDGAKGMNKLGAGTSKQTVGA